MDARCDGRPRAVLLPKTVTSFAPSDSEGTYAGMTAQNASSARIEITVRTGCVTAPFENWLNPLAIVSMRSSSVSTAFTSASDKRRNRTDMISESALETTRLALPLMLQFYRMIRLKTIDAHAAGEPLRLIVDGFPSPHGRTMLEKREWVRRHADHLRRALMLEPRGHADMYGAILTEAVSPGSHAGVLFMHNEGYSTMCGHGVIAVTTIALERNLLMPGGDGASVVFDSPAGAIRARAHIRAGGSGGSSESGGSGESSGAGRVESVAFVNVPSFVMHGGLS